VSTKLFTAGCIALILTGLVHLLGHVHLVTAEGSNEHERQLLSLMRSNPQDMGLGMKRTMFEILTGFSLTFSTLPLGMGVAGLVVRRQAASVPGMVRQLALVYAATWAVMVGVGLRYFFPAPLSFILAVCLLFTASAATARRT
jgi:hypothetical protein